MPMSDFHRWHRRRPCSPGMEGMGKVAYKVYAFDKTGKRFVYAER